MKTIVYAHVDGGVSLSHVIPRLVARHRVQVLSLTPLSVSSTRHLHRYGAGLNVYRADGASAKDVADRIVAECEATDANAVLGTSDRVLVSVSEAAHRLGLARAGDLLWTFDSRLKRKRWASLGLAVPHSRPIDSMRDLVSAYHELRPPLVLRPSWGGVGAGWALIEQEADLLSAWRFVTTLARARYRDLGLRHPYDAPPLIVDEVAPRSAQPRSSAAGPHEAIEVAGLVAGGQYRSLAVLRRAAIGLRPSGITCIPAGISASVEREVAELAGRAVDALGLQTCAVYTQVCLGREGSPMVIDVMAQPGDELSLQVIEAAFGIDPIAETASSLLDEPDDRAEWPSSPRRAAASVSLAGAAAGTRADQATRAAHALFRRNLLLVDPTITARSVTPIDRAAGGLFATSESLLMTAPNLEQLLGHVGNALGETADDTPVLA